LMTQTMNKICLTPFLLFLSLAKFSNAQIVHFPDTDGIWSVHDEKFYIDGDSLYNGKLYTKVYQVHDSVAVNGNFFALLREDTTTNKVYAISADSSTEYLLYDFSAALNDTITVFPLIFPFKGHEISVRVEEIDSILLGANY